MIVMPMHAADRDVVIAVLSPYEIANVPFGISDYAGEEEFVNPIIVVACENITPHLEEVLDTGDAERILEYLGRTDIPPVSIRECLAMTVDVLEHGKEKFPSVRMFDGDRENFIRVRSASDAEKVIASLIEAKSKCWPE